MLKIDSNYEIILYEIELGFWDQKLEIIGKADLKIKFTILKSQWQ